MADLNLQETSPDLGDLYQKARLGKITLDDFFDELARLDVKGLAQAMHASKAFGIGLGDAKLAYIERQPGRVRAWESQFDEEQDESDSSL
jgi:hypothetical protein